LGHIVFQQGVSVSAQIDALVAAAKIGDVTVLGQMLSTDGSLATADRVVEGVLERCPALCRAAGRGHVDAVKLLLKHGADPNAMFRDDYGTALTAACETLATGSGEIVKILLDAGADPVLADALFVACSTYARNAPEKHSVVKLLLATGDHAGQHPAVLAIHAGDVKALAAQLARDPGLLSKRFPDVDYLAWPLHCSEPTLLHIAADHGETALVRYLVAAGMDVNVRAGPGELGCGFQTAVFHCIASLNATGLGALRFLIEQRADLSVTAKVMFPDEAAGVCDGAGTVADLKPLGLAMRFANSPPHRNTSEACAELVQAGAVE